MPVIGLEHVRYETEKGQYDGIVELFEGLKKLLEDLRRKQESDKQQMLKLMSDSISVSGSHHVKDLVEKVKKRIRAEFDLDVFVARNELANVGCMYFNKENVSCPAGVVITSQHFFEDLEEDEQLFVLGHEIGHLLYGHTQIPTHVVLNIPPQPDPQKTETLFRLKKRVLGWHTAAEISADIVGMISTGCHSDPVLSALTKISTGLSGRSLQKLFVLHENNTLREFLDQQFEHVSESEKSNDLTTHPLIPARAKIANDLCGHFLLDNFGKDVPDLEAHVKDLTSRIDNIIVKVYEDVIPPERRDELLEGGAGGKSARSQLAKAVSEYMGTAVILADGFLVQEEFDALSGLISVDKKHILDALSRRLDAFNISGMDVGAGRLKLQPMEAVSQLVKYYVQQAADLTSDAGLDKPLLDDIMRNLLTLSIADGEVEQSELEVMKIFTSSFGVSDDAFYMLVNKILKEFKQS